MSAYGIKERKERWIDFLANREHPQHVFMIDYASDREDPPLPWREFEQERIEWAWRHYERQMARVTWLVDDTLPYLNVRTGTEIFAEAFGCPVYYPEDNMPFALPLIHSAGEVADLRVPEVSTSSLAYLFDIADELMRRAGTGTLVKVVDIQSPMDIASLIWDKSTFYPALIETPDVVRELADKVKQLLTAFLDAWFARYGLEFIAHYPDYYMPQGITLSEDEIGAVSVSTYEQLFLPELVELSARYGGMGVHCCAHAQHQWAGLKCVPNLRLLNLVQPEDVLERAYVAFSDVPQMHSWCGSGDPWTWPEWYPQDSRVVIQAQTETKDEALHLSEKLWVACKRT
ncbi:MAG: hypothetical protein JXA89_28650 [Anaerolineae bacterium]|nr:hypothetical protein [Anaerolineae bacterium]